MIPAPTRTSPKPSLKTEPITFSFEGTATYARPTQLLKDFERSIRPFDLNTLEITGTDSSLHLTWA